MADLNPKEIAEQIEKLAHALKSSRDFMDSFNESLNLTKTLMLSVRKSFSGANAAMNPLLVSSRAISKELKNAKEISDKIVVMKKGEVMYQNMLNSGISLTRKQTEALKNSMLEIEKMRHNLGRSGLAETFFLKGMASKYQSIQTFTKNYGVSMQAAGGYLKTLAPSMGKFGFAASKAGSVLNGMGLSVARLAGPIGIAVTAIVAAGKAIFEVFKQADEAAAKFRMTMGFTRTVTAQIDKDVRAMAIGMANVGVTFEMAYNSVVAIAATMGSLIGYSKDLAGTASLFTAQLGISADKTIQVAKAFAQISRSTMTAQRNVLGFVTRLSAAAGTNLSEVMNDIAEFSQSHYRFMKGSVEQLAKASVEARRMGTSLGSAGKSAAALLNFTQSITDEMEASVLLGRSIDAQRARSLAYAGDMEGLIREIVSQAEQAHFELMDPFQMAAFARTFGKTEDEIAKMIQASRELARAQAQVANDPVLREREALYQKMLKASKEQVRNYGQEYINDLQRQANQTRLVAIQQQWNKLIQELAQEWLPFIDESLAAMVPIIKTIAAGIKESLRPLIWTAKILSNIIESMKRFSESDTASNWGVGWENAAKTMANVLQGNWGRVISNIMEWVKPGSPHKIGQMYVDGFAAAGLLTEKNLTASIERVARNSIAASDIGIESVSGRTPPGIGPITPIVTARHAAQEDGNNVAVLAIMKVVESINQLRDDMLNGKIGANIRLDSQILAESTRRATDFRNGYGINNARA